MTRLTEVGLPRWDSVAPPSVATRVRKPLFSLRRHLAVSLLFHRPSITDATGGARDEPGGDDTDPRGTRREPAHEVRETPRSTRWLRAGRDRATDGDTAGEGTGWFAVAGPRRRGVGGHQRRGRGRDQSGQGGGAVSRQARRPASGQWLRPRRHLRVVRRSGPIDRRRSVRAQG